MPATSSALPALFASSRLHYAWVMLALTFLYSVFITSALGVPAVLILPMSRELGWSIGELAAPQGLRLAIFGLCAPLAGGLMLRYGPRVMTAISGALLLAGMLMSITMTSKWELWLGMGILLGLAPGITAMQLTAVVPTRWFVTHRGLAVGVLGSAVATGTLIFMPLAAWISEAWSWRVALLVPTIGATLTWLLFLWLARNRPQEVGLQPLGAEAPVAVPAAPTANFLHLSLRALAAGAKSRMFWLLAFTFGICGVSSFGLTQAHLVPFCNDIGVPLGVSAWLLAVIAVCDMIGTIGSGWLADRYDNRWLLAVYYGLRGVALVWLVYADVSTIALLTFAVIYGLDFIATLPPTVRLTVQSFGPDMGPAVFAWVFASHHVAAGLMAVGTGISRDAIGTYAPAFLLAGVLCIVAAVSFLATRRPRLAAAA
ncbi:MFS transporter [Ramlibacter solisilvae]|uniref:Monocarboxylate transporter permease n=1 Tax=Ramlibacter tataouinensis TaxID=94132 RepID=A0A127JU89_9BURK|nr:MFS transporter [Ramlibacter tataouinensis]AMO23429.1 monocarboxylate transporter permease [Ramlibacter tataouinensis]